MHAMLVCTAIGTTSFSWEGANTVAWASACTVTKSNAALSTGAKMPGARALPVTSMMYGVVGSTSGFDDEIAQARAVLRRRPVDKCDRLRGRDVCREIVGAGERCCVHGRLQLSVRVVPGADVDDERGHADDRREDDCDKDEDLPGLVAAACEERLSFHSLRRARGQSSRDVGDSDEIDKRVRVLDRDLRPHRRRSSLPSTQWAS